MASKYLDKDGLTRLWTTIKTAINQLVTQLNSLSSTVTSLNSDVNNLSGTVASNHNYDQHYVAYSDENTEWVSAYGGQELFLGLMLSAYNEGGFIGDSTEKIFACFHNIGQPDLTIILPDDSSISYPFGTIDCIGAMEYFKRNPQYFLVATDVAVNITLFSESNAIPVRTVDGEAPTITLAAGQTLELSIFLISSNDAGSAESLGRNIGDAPDATNSISSGVVMTQTYYVTYTIYS